VIDEDTSLPLAAAAPPRRLRMAIGEDADAPLLHPATTAYAGVCVLEEPATRLVVSDVVNQK
jgi:hypothetical protein